MLRQKELDARARDVTPTAPRVVRCSRGCGRKATSPSSVRPTSLCWSFHSCIESGTVSDAAVGASAGSRLDRFKKKWVEFVCVVVLVILGLQFIIEKASDLWQMVMLF